MNQIVEQIHSEFSLAEENLLKEVNAQLKRAEETDKEKLNALSSLGFSNFRELREIQPEEIERITKVKETVTKYSSMTNLYKFITDEKVIEICKKYGLVHAPINLYTDSIPRQNQDEILKFNEWQSGVKNLTSKTSLKSHNMTWNNSDISSMTSEHILNTISWIQRNWLEICRQHPLYKSGRPPIDLSNEYTNLYICFIRELFLRKQVISRDLERYNESLENFIPIHLSLQNRMEDKLNLPNRFFSNSQGDRNQIISNGISYNSVARVEGLWGTFFVLKDAVKSFIEKELNPKPEYTIVAAEYMVDLTNHIVNDDYKVIEKIQNIAQPELRFFRDDDPIVLYRVEGGYFIVSAWGKESSDENIANHNFN